MVSDIIVNTRVNKPKVTVCIFTFRKMNAYELRSGDIVSFTFIFYFEVEFRFQWPFNNAKTRRQNIIFREISFFAKPMINLDPIK